MPAARPIVVAIDGSEQAREALAWAVREAVHQHRSLEVVHAWEVPVPGYVPVPDSVELVRGAGEEILQAAVDRAAEWAPELDVEGRLVHGVPSRVLLDESESAAMLVVGSHGRSGVRRFLVGSVSTQVAEHSKVPVVVVHGKHVPGAAAQPAAWRPGPVVVGVDGSEISEDAVAFAFEAASRRGGDLLAVHVWTTQSPWVAESVAALVDPVDVQADGRQALSTSLAGYCREFPDVKVTPLVLAGGVVDGLVETAEEHSASLIVVGSRGRGGFAGLLLGSTSRGVLHHAQCPVTVVHPDASSSGGGG